MHYAIKAVLVLVGTSVFFALGMSLINYLFNRSLSLEYAVETAIFWFITMSLLIIIGSLQNKKKEK